MTPLQFESLYRADWEELENLLTALRGNRKERARVSMAIDSLGCIDARASTSRCHVRARIQAIWSIGSSS